MKTNPATGRGLWLGVALAFAMLIGAYVTFAVVAARHPVKEVPLATAPARR
jgi:hypothetical protein